MKNRILGAITAIAIAMVALLMGASPASAATVGGRIHNQSNDLIYISAYNPYSQPATMQPGTDSYWYMTNVQCFKPRITMRSQYGGLYYAGVIRCMSTNNVILWLDNP